jgi:ketosteroid isomerase-like protein
MRSLTRILAAALVTAGVVATVAAASDRRQAASLEASVQDLKAKDEIREMFNRYGFTADTGDAEGWSKVWAKDAVYESAMGTMTGREAFRQSIADPKGVHKTQIEGKGSLHTTGPLTIRVNGESAWAEGYTLVWVRTDDGGYKIFTLSYNHWDLSRAVGHWEIARRISRPVAPGNAAKVLTAWRNAD